MTSQSSLFSERAWFLVCDGARALLLQNVGDQAYPFLTLRRTIENNRRGSPSNTNHTDRTATRNGSHSAGSVAHSLSLKDEIAFLSEVLGDLEHHCTMDSICDLVIVAPPHVLGILRPMQGPCIKKILRAEITKDYVKLPAYEIEQHLLHLDH